MGINSQIIHLNSNKVVCIQCKYMGGLLVGGGLTETIYL